MSDEQVYDRILAVPIVEKQSYDRSPSINRKESRCLYLLAYRG